MKIGFYRRYVNSKIKALRELLYLKNIRKKNKNKDFTIISNNCWGGSIYEDLQLPYKTPTVGLFFFAPCYIQFLQNLKDNLKEEIIFIKQSKYEKGNLLLRTHTYPIGLIKGRIEVHFLHYKTETEALDKWRKRAERVNFNNIFLSFTDNEVCTAEEINTFDSLLFNKVFFSAKDVPGIKSLVFLKGFEGQAGIGNIYDDRWKYRKYFDVVKWLNAE
jgi:uncharacterized protein (DUF1919 family)